jgi:hypothetical protein
MKLKSKSVIEYIGQFENQRVLVTQRDGEAIDGIVLDLLKIRQLKRATRAIGAERFNDVTQNNGIFLFRPEVSSVTFIGFNLIDSIKLFYSSSCQ